MNQWLRNVLLDGPRSEPPTAGRPMPAFPNVLRTPCFVSASKASVIRLANEVLLMKKVRSTENSGLVTRARRNLAVLPVTSEAV